MIADALRRAEARGFRILEIQGDPNAARFYGQVGATPVGEREPDISVGRAAALRAVGEPADALGDPAEANGVFAERRLTTFPRHRLASTLTTRFGRYDRRGRS
jgi:hypothetical protein